jgi:hypothetical protein
VAMQAVRAELSERVRQELAQRATVASA